MSEFGAQVAALQERVTVQGKGAFGVRPDRQVLNRIAEGGPVDIVHHDDVSGLTSIETIQDTDAIAKAVREQRLHNSGWNKSRDWKTIARLPLVVIDMLYRKKLNVLDRNDWPKIASMIDDGGELEQWKTSDGHIGKRRRRSFFTPPSRKQAR